MRHILKCHADNFDAVVEGRKRFEIRHEDDRRFAVGDVLALVRTDKDGIPTSPSKWAEVDVLHVARKAGPLSLFGIDVDDGGVAQRAPVAIAVLSIMGRRS